MLLLSTTTRLSAVTAHLFPTLNLRNNRFLSTMVNTIEKATFAAGCFWGVEKVFFKHFKQFGIETRVGYTGGKPDAKNPTYRQVRYLIPLAFILCWLHISLSIPRLYVRTFAMKQQVCNGIGNHAEALEIKFSPEKVSYEALVEFFYRMHDPTTVNKQGPDEGPQYRSAIFYHSVAQREIAERVTAEVQEAHYKGKPIVTTIVEGDVFYDAEDYHQQYLEKNPHGYECPTHFLRW
ncbi:peptide methionine sulfoxide reductase [Jimgerdemannia flammicorona]|uniref:peptide-methionine (S)-S-oxide reductase n=1 Tax=Jimgerdemannia flammicorona TaxID=994334 RepID=A0A433D8U3_9FUNG|nr:peptide methionine sulfoxide reductase [Jimgerdemannia flammicorona]